MTTNSEPLVIMGMAAIAEKNSDGLFTHVVFSTVFVNTPEAPRALQFERDEEGNGEAVATPFGESGDAPAPVPAGKVPFEVPLIAPLEQLVDVEGAARWALIDAMTHADAFGLELRPA